MSDNEQEINDNNEAGFDEMEHPIGGYNQNNDDEEERWNDDGDNHDTDETDDETDDEFDREDDETDDEDDEEDEWNEDDDREFLVDHANVIIDGVDYVA